MGVSVFRAEAQRALAFGSIGAGYAAIGAAIAKPVSKMYVANLTDATLQFSFDGTVDHFVLPAQGALVLDVSFSSESEQYMSIGTVLQVKRIGTPTVGSVYLSTFYGKTR